MTTVPYDPSALAPSNKLTVRWGVNTHQKIYVPTGAPFYSATLTLNDVPLIEGKDYEYTYSLSPLEVSEHSWWGALQFILPVAGIVECEMQVVGGSFLSDPVGALDTLIKKVNENNTRDWETQITDRPVLFPAAVTYDSWYDFLNKQYVSGSLDTLSVSNDTVIDYTLAPSNAMIVAKLETFKSLLQTINADGHVDSVDPHNTTVVQLKAHPALSPVPNARKVYDKGLGELARSLAANGFTYEDISGYLTTDVEYPYTGTMVFSTSKILERGSAFFELGYQINIAADVLTLPNVSLYTPEHTLVMNPKNIRFNNADVVSVATIGKYVGDDTEEEPRLSVVSYNLDVKGDGSSSNPITINNTSLDATDNTSMSPGGVRLVNAAGPQRRGYAVTPRAVNTLTSALSDYVTMDFTINGSVLANKEITFTASSIGLGKVNNTRDLAKPLSESQILALGIISVKNHKHPFTEFNYLPATATVPGLVKILQTQSTETGGVLSPNSVKVRADQITARHASYSNRLGRTDFDHATSQGGMLSVSNWDLSVDTPIEVHTSVNGIVSRRYISGNVNLNNIQVTNWHLRENHADGRWDTAYDLGTPIGLHPNSRRITVDETYGTLGSPSRTARVKLRLANLPGQRLRYKITGSKRLSCWVNNNELFSGASPDAGLIQGNVTVNSGALAISIEISTGPGIPGWVEAIFYDDYDRIVAVTDASWVTAMDRQLVPPNNTTFFLYGDTGSGLVYATASPEDPTVIDPSRVMLGVIRTGDTGISGAVGNKVSLPKLVDIGQYNAMDRHISDPDAHSLPYKEDRFEVRAVARSEDTTISQWWGEGIGKACLLNMPNRVLWTKDHYSSDVSPVWKWGWCRVSPGQHSPYRYYGNDNTYGNISSWWGYVTNAGQLRDGIREQKWTLGSELALGGLRTLVLGLTPTLGVSNELTLSPVTIGTVTLTDTSTSGNIVHAQPSVTPLEFTVVSDTIENPGPVPDGPQRWTLQYCYRANDGELDILMFSATAARLTTLRIPTSTHTLFASGDMGVMGSYPTNMTLDGIVAGNLYTPPCAQDLNDYTELYRCYPTTALTEYFNQEEESINEVRTVNSYVNGLLGGGFTDIILTRYPTGIPVSTPHVEYYDYHRGLPIGWLPLKTRDADFKIGRWGGVQGLSPVRVAGIYRRGRWGVGAATWRYILDKL